MVLIAGDVGRNDAAASVAVTDRFLLYRPNGNAGELLTATPDLISSSAGDVVGPASAVSGNLASFNTTTGKLIQDSGIAAANTVTLAGSQSLTNKTMASGTNAISAAIMGDVKRTSAAVTKNASAAYANVTGLSQTVVPGTYRFSCRLPSTVANGTGGIKYAFNYTTTVLSAMQSSAAGYTASAVAVQNVTSTTTQADLFTQAAVVIRVEIDGTMVVTTGGTIDLQMAQNTSNGSDTVALIGGTMEFTRIA